MLKIQYSKINRAYLLTWSHTILKTAATRQELVDIICATPLAPAGLADQDWEQASEVYIDINSPQWRGAKSM